MGEQGLSNAKEKDDALRALLAALGREGYRFTAITPESHRRVVARPRMKEAKDLRGVFGWNLPFRADLLPDDMLEALQRADAVGADGGMLRSRLRVASIGSRLFLHSAFPTDEENSVFFGPDTYRFVDMLQRELPRTGRPKRLVDLGAGAGPGGISAAAQLPGTRITLVDLNAEALRLAAANAAHAGVEVELIEGESLDDVPGRIDLVIANPPYMMDEEDRAYRAGGGMRGAQLSLAWAIAAARRLEPSGHLLLYTGVAIADGRDPLREALERQLPELGCTMRYREIDPDIFGEELEQRPYRDVERIAAVSAVIARGAG